MSGEEKKAAKTIADALKVLPEKKKEYLLGYAEGVVAMAEEVSKDSPPGSRGD